MKKIVILTMCLVLVSMLSAATLQTKSPNTLEKSIVQTVDITGRSDLLFDQHATFNNNLYACQWDSVMPFVARITDNFTVPYEANIDSVVWWGGYWNPGAPGVLPNFWIEIYPDSTVPNQPAQNPIYSERVPYTEVFMATDRYYYEAVIPLFHAYPATTYWIVFMPTMVYPPQWGNDCAIPPDWGDGQPAYFKSDYFGFPLWTPIATALGYGALESSFQIFGSATGIEEQPGKPGEPLSFGFTTVPSLTRGRTTIEYITSISGNVALAIYDYTGRPIRTLINANEPAGTKTVYWDGKDNTHSSVADGIYFVRLEAQGKTATQKLVFIR